MRKIKFRGKNIKTGEIHYGHYSDYPVSGGRIETCITDKNLDGWIVDPETVAQFVGYDEDGKEVYDDDDMVDEFGYEAPALYALAKNDFGEKLAGFWLKESEKMIENLNENILPRPVIRDGNGKLIKDHTPKDLYLKLQEEIFGIVWLVKPNQVIEKIADVITVCISYLNALGYDEEKRSELFAKVNEKNEKRGYFKECK